MKLPFMVRKPILACGADLKGAFALAKGDAAFLYEGFGDLSDLGNFERYENAVSKAIKKTGIKPAVIAHDMHPGYFSTRFAEDFAQKSQRAALYAIQHHEAHVASCIVDNDIKGSVIGVAFDGTGYGLDGNIWGGEFFIGSVKGFKRAAHLEYVPMPGGDAAIRQPWRMAVSYLYTARHSEAAKRPKNLKARSFGSSLRDSPQDDRKISRAAFIIDMIEKKINSPLTSSAGRLFDAAASLVLRKDTADFEAELPIALEKIVDRNCDESYTAALPSDSAGIIKRVAADVDRKVDSGIISARFHNTVSGMIAQTAKRLCKQYRAKKIVLSGGVFQNKFLSEKTVDMLNGGGFSVYTHKNISTTDSGIPVGQIAIANARCRIEK